MNARFHSHTGVAAKRRTLDGLAVFCAVQRSRFDPAAWLRRSAHDGRRVAFAARYLAMTGWYGHEAELEVIAEKIIPGIANIDTYMQEIQTIDIALAQLSSTIRFGVVPSSGASPSGGSENDAAPLAAGEQRAVPKGRQ